MASSPGGSDASHESDNDGANSSKTPTGKDKECPYCHQRFTSSSLGRHLDQFLSKKKPDGVHDVDEIKRSRAGITRRTARGKKGDQQDRDNQATSSHASPSSAVPTKQDVVSPSHADTSSRDTTSHDVRFNRLGWQATGVITDQLSNNTVASPTTAPVNGQVAGTKRSFSIYASDAPAASNDNTRALELSLREVLDAVNNATKRIEASPQPFPFDMTSLSFPAIVLALLPTPATLNQSAPFSTNATIPFKPPGFEQLETVRGKIRSVLDQWKWDALAHVQRSSMRNGISVGQEAERLHQTAQLKIGESLLHLDNAFQAFMSQPPEQQYQLWTIEILRAYKIEQDKVKIADEKIARISQEADQLQQQIDHLSRCQWPREMALWPPERNTFSSAVQKELQNARTPTTTLDSVNAIGTNSMPPRLPDAIDDQWDFDKLVNKWKRHVREDRARRGGSGLMLPPVSENANASPRVDTPPHSLRKALSESHANGNRIDSANNSPINRNASAGWTIGITDKYSTVANSGPNSSVSRSHAGTPMNHNNSRTHTPVNRAAQAPTVQIISDVDDQMARFAPWYQQEREMKMRERERERREVDVGD